MTINTTGLNNKGVGMARKMRFNFWDDGPNEEAIRFMNKRMNNFVDIEIAKLNMDFAMQSVIDRMRWWEARDEIEPMYYTMDAWDFRMTVVAHYLEAQGL